MISIPDTVRLAYRAGLCVLPVANDGSKRPVLESWREFKVRRPTPAESRAFDWTERAGLGIVAGPVSGRVETWDFDHHETFDQFLAEAAECGLGGVVVRIRSGYEDATPGGGRRWLVRYPESVTWKDCRLARRPGRDGEPKVKTLIELPTFAIVAPSNAATHPSGKPYVRLLGGFDAIASYTSDEREALIALARTFDEMPRSPHSTHVVKAINGIRPGDDFARRTEWSALLEPVGWTRVCERGDATCWRRPGKQIGISATTNYHGSDLLYVFTSSTEFDPEKSYTKFGAYAVLHHGSDFGRAALALAERGYGRTPKLSERTKRQASSTPPIKASWRWLRDIRREYVAWLWRTRLAFGTLTLWIGDGGLGKSRLSNDIAARVTTGALWPDGELAERGTVIILSAEDAASYTIRPAIEAAGGDVSRVAILDAVRDDQGTERTFQIGTDLAALEQLLDATAASLVIIDPLSAYFGTTLDSYRDTDVRAVLEPVVKLAERRRVAVLGIMHVGKGTDRQARHRALGSVAFVNAARLVFAIGPDPDDPARRLLVAVKANLCREAAALAFRLEDAGGVARIVWDTAPVADVTADTVLNNKPVLTDEEAQDAEQVVRVLLDTEDWPLDAKHALDAGRAHGISERTMRRAARKLGIEIRKLGFRAGWRWHRPAEGDTPAPNSPPEDSQTPTTAKGDTEGAEGVGMSFLSPSQILSPSQPSKGPSSPCAPSQETQQDRPSGEGDSSVSTRARELTEGDSAAVPAWVTESAEPDTSDPIGKRDEDDPGVPRA